MTLSRKLKSQTHSKNRCMTGTVNIFICSEAAGKNGQQHQISNVENDDASVTSEGFSSDERVESKSSSGNVKKLNFAKSQGESEASPGENSSYKSQKKDPTPICTCPDVDERETHRQSDRALMCTCDSTNSVRIEKKSPSTKLNSELCSCTYKGGDVWQMNQSEDDNVHKVKSKEHKSKVKYADGSEVREKCLFIGKPKTDRTKNKKKKTKEK